MKKILYCLIAFILTLPLVSANVPVFTLTEMLGFAFIITAIIALIESGAFWFFTTAKKRFYLTKENKKRIPIIKNIKIALKDIGVSILRI